jgi:DNA-directed DNA polymerase III PolC
MTRIRSGYSFRVAYGHIKDVASRLKEIGLTRSPLTDRDNTFSFAKWSALVEKPIYGCELAVVPALGEKQPHVDFFTFLAIENLKPLHELILTATGNPGKFPMLLYSQVNEASGLIKIAGERVMLEHLNTKDKNTFMALSPSLSKGIYTDARKRKVKFIAASDNSYPRAEDKETYRVALGKRSNTQSYPLHILSDDEWNEALWIVDPKDKEAALKNRAKVFDRCVATLNKAKLLSPPHPKTLRELCLEGAKRTGVDLHDPIYSERLDRELSMIAEKKFEDYFFIIADMVSWAKQRMIVGPARGSSCGSLACYLLNITAVDPIPFGLIFERFIDTTRADLPDIDIDFSDTKRAEVFAYAEDKYGIDHVARLGSVSSFKSNSALNAAGAALRVPKWLVGKMADSIIDRSSGDSRALQTIEDTFIETDAGRKMMKEFPEMAIAQHLEGHPTNSGQHAAGLLLTESPIIEHVAIDARTKCAMCDKYDAEKLNLLKIDALGLTQLSIFERTLELIGQKPISGWLEKLPLDDPAAFDVLNRQHFAGVFQFNGMALQSLAKQITIDKLDDIVAITALARPGPMATGGANLWVKRRMKQAAIEYPHPVIEPYLNETLGIVIYQEEVLSIGREVGDLSWAQVTQLRKAMSKSLGEEYFDQFGDPWKEGAMKRGIPKETADQIWKSLCSMGSWAFNKAHAVAYGLVSYYCCWFKAHYPEQFAAATLDAERDPMRQISFLRELAQEGIDYVDVDPDHSVERWSIAKRGEETILIGPLTAIKGIGPATVTEILSARKRGEELRPTLAKKLKEARTDLWTLYPVRAAFNKLVPDPVAANIVSPMINVRNIQCGMNGPFVTVAIATRIAPRDENDPANVAKRGYKLNGPTQALNMFVRDDTDEIFAKINRYDYEEIGREIAERGREKKSLYLIKGRCPVDFRMISIDRIRYLGELE